MIRILYFCILYEAIVMASIEVYHIEISNSNYKYNNSIMH